MEVYNPLCYRIDARLYGHDFY